jgi:hypothetical protein
MGTSEPLVESVTAASYVIPTEGPEFHGTLAPDSGLSSAPQLPSSIGPVSSEPRAASAV